jgi:hypothetical protein
MFGVFGAGLLPNPALHPFKTQCLFLELYPVVVRHKRNRGLFPGMVTIKTEPAINNGSDGWGGSSRCTTCSSAVTAFQDAI